MVRKSVKGLITLGIVKGLITIVVLLFFTVFSECDASAEVEKPSELISEGYIFEELNPDERYYRVE